MTATIDATDKPIQSYTRLLRRLHALFLEEKNESPEADAIRDEMDSSWYSMTSAECERMRGLSEDLYAVDEGKDLRVHLDPTVKQQWDNDFKAAFERNDFDRVLTLLRRPPDDVPMDIVWFTVHLCWKGLDDPEMALYFLKAAEKLNREYTVDVMFLLQEMGRREESLEYANRLIADPQATYADLYLASAKLIGETPRTIGSSVISTDPARLSELRRIVSALRAALEMVRRIPVNNRQFPTEARIARTLAFCLAPLGEIDSALQLYGEILQRNPADADALAFRGLELLSIEPDQAIEDLEAAVRLGTQSVFPYYILANKSLEAKDYARCLNLAESGLKRTADPRILADLNEAIGVSKFMQGFPAKSVLSSFRTARELAPSNDRIAHNYAIAMSALYGSADKSELRIPKYELKPDYRELLATEEFRQVALNSGFAGAVA